MREMTLAEARAEGLLDGKSKLKRTTRRSAPRGGAESRCVTHGESFTTDAAENRHVDAHHGCRLETTHD